MISRISFLVAFVFLLACGCQQKEGVGLSVGQTAPALAGTDTAGQSVKLSDYKGKVVLLDFWATWCPPCREMVPHSKELAKRFEGQPFALLGVSVDNGPDELRDFMQQKDMTWTNIFDGAGGPVAKAWKINGYPTIFVIDAKGVIRFKQEGYNAASASKIDNAIEKALKDMRY